MRCLLCSCLCLTPLCKKCKYELTPKLNKRRVDGEFFCYSFFGYDDIAPLLHTKHNPVGMYVYKYLSRICFEPFLKEQNKTLHLLSIDDIPKSGYSHTAVLTKSIRAKNINTHFASLRATNNISYSGKSLKFRKDNPRKFKLNFRNAQNVVLVDDIITTGTTLLEAKKTLQKSGITPLFAITLADAKVK